MDGSADDASWREAERVFLGHLERVERGEEPDFEELCRAHPQLEPELRELNEQRELLIRILGREGADPLDEVAGEAGGADVLALRYSRYRFHEHIDRGGQGEVLMVRDPDLGRRVAMKRLRLDGGRPFSSASRSKAESRLCEEAQITGQLAHPGIVPVHEVGVDSRGRVFFTMELVRGEKFSRVLRWARAGEQGWTLQGALRVMLRVCQAVAYAHSRRVLHRDLKPSNVMVGRFGETYVMDWGFARVLEGSELREPRDPSVSASQVATDRTRLREQGLDSPLISHEGEVFGTPSYMPPEQARGNLAEVGTHSDVYAAGAMLYHLLTGRAPYTTPGEELPALAIVDRVKAGPPRSVRELDPEAPEELADICAMAMAREPADRYPDMSAMAADLEAYLDRRPISARPAGLLYVLRLAFQRNRTLAWTVVAALAVLVGTSALYVVDLRRANTRTQRQLDFYAAGVLEDQADRLFPPVPATLPRMDEWLERADDLLARRRRYAGELERAGPESPAQLVEAVATLDRVAELRDEVRGRRAVAAGLRERTIEAEADAWRAAAEAVAALPVYGGLELAPQLGLVPLGPDPDSGLWEFWNVLSGDRPARDGQGRVSMSADAGVVLVLVPPGRYRMGSPLDEPDRMPDEGPRERVVGAFFLSKFELTQGQWERIAGANPSYYAPGLASHETPSGGRREERISASHPVENVTWHDATNVAWRLDLRLPREVEWEYAARAGTTGMHAFGDRLDELEGRENVRDLALSPMIVSQDGAGWDDGHALHAPVGRFDANRFGLFDVHGNVSEWCEDEVRDPGETSAAQGLRVFRGGSWLSPLFSDRLAFRNLALPWERNQALGVRLARDLEPPPPR